MNKYILTIVLFSTLFLIACSSESKKLTDDLSAPPITSPVTDIQEGLSTVGIAQVTKERGNYNIIKLNKLPKALSLTGSDPKAIAIAAFPPPDEEPQEGNFQRDVIVNKVAPNFVTVFVTENGLLDDSVHGIRTRLDFEASGSDGKSWKMVWIGSQYKCHQGRGQQDWSKKLCT